VGAQKWQKGRKSVRLREQESERAKEIETYIAQAREETTRERQRPEANGKAHEIPSEEEKR